MIEKGLVWWFGVGPVSVIEFLLAIAGFGMVIIGLLWVANKLLGNCRW